MRSALFLLAAALLVVLGPGPRAVHGEDHAPAGLFSDWSAETFTRAKRERRIIVVTVSTSWCHWCHVMKRDTYGNAGVRAVLDRRFLPIDVDADQRPDLAERFRNYRWPATAFLTPDGVPVLALRGHRYPAAFLEVLTDVERRVARGGPYPGFQQPSKAGGVRPTTDEAGLRTLRERLRRELDEHWDPAQAGWGTKQKYPVPGPVEYGLFVAKVRPDDEQPLIRAIATLQATEHLIDREWGGVYQYSVGATWTKWHPEKIIPVNAGALRTYALAAEIASDAKQRTRFRRDANDVYTWLDEWMRAPSGAYYTSQDADAPRLAGEQYYRLPGSEREQHGLPRIDTSVYAAENGLVIQALVAADRGREALAAARVIRGAHRTEDGAFRHAADSRGPLFLTDQVEMGRAFLALHQHDPRTNALLLDDARRVHEVMVAKFKDPATGGFFDSTADPAAVGVFKDRIVSLEPNAAAARFLLDLAAVIEEPDVEQAALDAIRAVGTEQQIDRHWRNVAGLLIAVERALAPWARARLERGTRSNPLEGALRDLTREHPLVYWTIEDSNRPDGVAYVCGRGYCSDAVRTGLDLTTRVRDVLAGDP